MIRFDGKSSLKWQAGFNS